MMMFKGVHQPHVLDIVSYTKFQLLTALVFAALLHKVLVLKKYQVSITPAGHLN